MDAIKRKRTQLRRNFTTLEKSFLTSLSSSDADIEACFEALKDAMDSLLSVEEEVCEAYCTSEQFSETEFEQDQDRALEYKQRWAEAKSKFNRLVKSSHPPLTRHNSHLSIASNPSEFNTVHSNQRRKNMKMPKLELPKFDGKVKNWLAFWGQFSKIHEDTELDDIDKFQYLLQSTTVNSPAHQLVSSYPPSAANYSKAIAALKARFARDDILIETYVRGLLSLVWSQLKGDKCSLTQLYDSLQTHLQALETLNVMKTQ